jgi:putative serine/threonine protein kinase
VEVERRLRELHRLGVSFLDFVGEKEVSDLHIIGKGWVGLVVLANWKHRQVALKIRRVDADRERMEREAKLLEVANSVNVGPKLLGVTGNFLLMEFVDGVLLPEWSEMKRKKAELREVLRDVLEQCWKLDRIGLDHGELSNAPKHIIVNKKNVPVIVDFESASLKRKSSNVTSLFQFLFVGSAMARNMAKMLGETDKTKVVEALREYKKDRSRENFEKVLTVSGLQMM